MTEGAIHQTYGQTKIRGTGCDYVQAWSCFGPEFDGIVYTQQIALDKLALGCDIEAVTIIRHDNGDREYEAGTLAQAVYQRREGKPCSTDG